MRKSRLVLVVFIGLLALAVMPAHADTLTFTFTSDHCSGGCSTGAANMGTITVSQTAGQALTGTVSVDVQLESGFGFIDTGAGSGASFFFRLLPVASGPTITYSGITSGWTIPDVIGTNQQAAGSYAGDGLMNQFEYALDCKAGGACGNGGSSPAPPPLDFTVQASGLTPNSFNDTGNASGSPFAADVLSSNGKTGLIDGSLATTPSGVPEPASIALLGGVLALTIRKFRRRNA